MATETVTLQIPEILYQRLLNTAHAQRRSTEIEFRSRRWRRYYNRLNF
jgi:hypothetical protein